MAEKNSHNLLSLMMMLSTQLRNVQRWRLYMYAHLIGISAAQAAFPELPQVAVFDTAFHQTIPEKSYIYALPYGLYREHGVRRYGMHGTSHYFISQKLQLNKPVEETNIISCTLVTVHLSRQSKTVNALIHRWV